MNICLGTGNPYSYCHITTVGRLCRSNFSKLDLLLCLSHFK